MKEYTIKFTTSDAFESVIERVGYRYQTDGNTKLKQLILRQISLLVGGKFMSNVSISYKTLKKVKDE